MTEDKKLSGAEYEKKLLDAEQKAVNDPLDVHAAMVKYYIPRLKGQLNNMSKKQILTLATDLTGSSFNQQSDVNKLLVLTKDMGLSAVRRVFTGAIVNPFDEVELNITLDKEKRLFVLFDSLLTNKYLNCIATGLSEAGPEKKQELEDFILHSVDVNGTIFKKRDRVEKDAFFTANKLLCSKFLMILVTTAEFRDKKEKEQNG